MAYDGFTVAAVVAQLGQRLEGGRIARISQPEKDALLLTVKTPGEQLKLLLSADASLPLVYLTEESKPAPKTAPNFCMVMRKHLSNARILAVEQPGLERIIRFRLEHLDEMGDPAQKVLVVELMGKHSNIILIDNRDVVVDSIKRISAVVSSVREVLPGRPYFIPDSLKKADPLKATKEDFLQEPVLAGKNMSLYKALMNTYMGISPQAASEMLRLAGVDGDRDLQSAFSESTVREALWQSFSSFMEKVRQGDFSPVIYYENSAPADFAAIDTGAYPEKKRMEDISAVLRAYYAQKEMRTRIRQRSADLRHIVQTACERASKKLDLQERQMKDTEKREKYRIYGELLTAYAHDVPAGARSYEALNYYDNTTVTIPLDETLSAMENAGRFFARYQKQKRTFEALSEQIRLTKEELEHIETIQLALDIAEKEEDLKEIRRELAESGYVKKAARGKQEKSKSKPLHYVTAEGFHIYVGKNNTQNDMLTFKMATGGDWWFHAKKLAGSHVVVKTEGKELPDRVFEQAAALAACYSRAANQEKAEVDYLLRKNVKKPAGAAPGFVVYYTNYSMAVKPGIDPTLTALEE